MFNEQVSTYFWSCSVCSKTLLFEVVFIGLNWDCITMLWTHLPLPLLHTVMPKVELVIDPPRYIRDLNMCEQATVKAR